ncbi:RluA family pseudouridine synthase [Mycoplasmoides alvi]|uniref:RluA family pseudouridine synthase n=1 Tax=Mycoplasmoides alvi TaxID=78580 RepID=UPI00051AE9C8|nr:RluA family pseudouridine synthase [Mycoplasmoides alvi]
MTKHTIKLNKNEKRLDIFLANYLSLSRNKTSFLILNSYVKVNKLIVIKNNFSLKAGDIVEVNYDSKVFLEEKVELKPYEFPLNIIYEDDDLIIIDKPKDLITHPTSHNKTTTLLNAVLHHVNKEKYEKLNCKNNIYMVHRLDKDTTGLIVIAKNFFTMSNLQEQIKNRDMKRFYLAIVNYPFNETTGTIDAPIGRLKGDNTIRFSVINAKNPKKSITKFYVLDQNSRYALIKCELLTGRTHQIRVHMSFIEHWILNDPIYGIKSQKLEKHNQYLHAYQLEFTHPKTGKKLFFQAPITKEFKLKLNTLNLSINKSIEYV